MLKRQETLVELDGAGGFRKQRVVAAQPDVIAGVNFGAALPDQDIAGQHVLNFLQGQTQLTVTDQSIVITPANT